MRHILFALVTLISFSASAQDVIQTQNSTDSLTEEQKELLYSLAEQYALDAVDSLIQEGMYMQAIKAIDSLQVNWKKVTGRELSARTYLRKSQIYMSLEEWQQLVNTTTDCINSNKDNMSDRQAALFYSMQGSGYRYLEDYKNAILSYEHALGYYTKIGDLGSQGDILCSIAYSYDKLGKHSTASSFYEKGVSKFLQYFNSSKNYLLQNDLKVEDSYMRSVMGVFGAHLYNMAVYEQNLGDRNSSKEFLLMSAHCGNSTAISEYERIYGILNR